MDEYSTTFPFDMSNLPFEQFSRRGPTPAPSDSYQLEPPPTYRSPPSLPTRPPKFGVDYYDKPPTLSVSDFSTTFDRGSRRTSPMSDYDTDGLNSMDEFAKFLNSLDEIKKNEHDQSSVFDDNDQPNMIYQKHGRTLRNPSDPTVGPVEDDIDMDGEDQLYRSSRPRPSTSPQRKQDKKGVVFEPFNDYASSQELKPQFADPDEYYDNKEDKYDSNVKHETDSISIDMKIYQKKDN